MPKGRLRVVITYEPSGQTGRPIPLASLTDPGNVAHAARAAMEESVRRANVLSHSDPGLSEVERAEGARLRHLFGALIPGLAAHAARPA